MTSYTAEQIADILLMREDRITAGLAAKAHQNFNALYGYKVGPYDLDRALGERSLRQAEAELLLLGFSESVIFTMTQRLLAQIVAVTSEKICMRSFEDLISPDGVHAPEIGCEQNYDPHQHMGCTLTFRISARNCPDLRAEAFEEQIRNALIEALEDHDRALEGDLLEPSGGQYFDPGGPSAP